MGDHALGVQRIRGRLRCVRKVYGSFGVIVASLVWIYFSAAIFVLGAEVTALLTERQHRAAAALFALQNGSPTTLRFPVWAAHDVPLAGVVLLALAAGAFNVGVPFRSGDGRLSARLRRLKANRQTAGPDSSA